MGPFRYEPENSPGTVYNINVVPFQRGNSAVPVSALLTAEDLTQTEQLRQLEVEAENLRLVKSMADRMAHEIGNTMVPLSTHQQLLAEKYDDKEFRESLDHALADGVKRVTRLVSQMRFLAREGHHRAADLSRRQIDRGRLSGGAQTSAGRGRDSCNTKKPTQPINLTGDRAALKHALSEIMLNALQANPEDADRGRAPAHRTDTSGRHDLQIEVQDNGSGFTAEAAKRVPSAFFTTRNVGLGLGPDRQPENHRDAPRQAGNCPAAIRPARRRPRFPADGAGSFPRRLEQILRHHV